MDHIETARLAGTSLDDLDELLRGRSTANVARRLAVTMADVDEFIRGTVSAPMSARIGFATLSAADELAKALGQQGRIGLLIGILFCAE